MTRQDDAYAYAYVDILNSITCKYSKSKTCSSFGHFKMSEKKNRKIKGPPFRNNEVLKTRDDVVFKIANF